MNKMTLKYWNQYIKPLKAINKKNKNTLVYTIPTIDDPKKQIYIDPRQLFSTSNLTMPFFRTPVDKKPRIAFCSHTSKMYDPLNIYQIGYISIQQSIEEQKENLHMFDWYFQYLDYFLFKIKKAEIINFYIQKIPSAVEFELPIFREMAIKHGYIESKPVFNPNSGNMIMQYSKKADYV